MLASGVPAEPSDKVSLTADALTPIIAEAIARWNTTKLAQDSGVNLQNTPVRVVDLPGQILGQATQDFVLIDLDAAGHGWFIDTTPADDLEFVATKGLAWRAEAGAANRRMDLLTVIMHEFGHILGLPDLDPTNHDGDLMVGILGLGERRQVTARGTTAPMVAQPPVESPSKSDVLPASTLVRYDSPVLPTVPAPTGKLTATNEDTRDALFAQLSGSRPRLSKAFTTQPSQGSSMFSGNGWLDELAKDLAGADKYNSQSVEDGLDDLLKQL